MNVEKNLKKLMAVAGVAAGFSLFAVSGVNAAPIHKYPGAIYHPLMDSSDKYLS